MSQVQAPAQVLIDGKYNGPPASANGGFACGTFAVAMAGQYSARPVVTLHAPPPLEQPMLIRTGPRRGLIGTDDELVATVTASRSEVPLIPPVQLAVAAAAEPGYRGLTGSPFPTCFVCGTARAPGEGLRLAPGPIDPTLIGPDAVACSWTAAGPITEELVWAVLDCPGGWTGDPVHEPMVLARMTVVIDELPTAGQDYVVVGRRVSHEVATATNDTALYDPAGRPLARARALWGRLPQTAS